MFPFGPLKELYNVYRNDQFIELTRTLHSVLKYFQNCECNYRDSFTVVKGDSLSHLGNCCSPKESMQ